MNTMLSCFTATIAFLVVAIGGRDASSMDNIVWVMKCCLVDHLYDPKVRFCRPVGANGDEHDQRLMDRLGSGFRVASNATLKSYSYWPHCGDTQVLVDVPTEEVRMLMETDPSPIRLPQNYCFDLTPSDELVARTCRSRDQYCGRGNYMCVRKCCPVGRLFDPNERFCRRVGVDGDEHDQRLMDRLGSGFRVATNATLKSYGYSPPYCHVTRVLVDVPTEKVRMLMKANPSPIDLPQNYCFDLTPSDELVARTCRPRNQYCGQGNEMCVRKCCPVDRLYDPNVRFCRPVGVDGDEHDQRLMDRLGSGFQVATNATLKSYNFGPLYCDEETEVLVDVPTEEVRMLMEADPSPIDLPQNYCFDLTPSDELVARTCRPRYQYCGRNNYTCVSKCCEEGKIFYPITMGMLMCKYSEMPFQFYAYETDVGVSPVGLSNNKVLPYYGYPWKCSAVAWIHNRVTLTTDGNLHVIHEGVEWIIPITEYCVDYHTKDERTGAADLIAMVCSKPPVSFLFWFKTLSVVCLVLTLIVYATLPFLRNAHGYYVMFYMACHLVYLVCIMIYSLVHEDTRSPLCIPFGYFMLFATLITCCWLNVICFDIYWMLRYNNSTNRNTSKSVRTIMYHIYCWGFPSICVSTGYLFQHSKNKTLHNLAPDIGVWRCFFFEIHRPGTLIFYWLPSCGTLTVNLILFLLTAIHCSRIKAELNRFRQTDSKKEIFLVYKERFVMNIKLFLVFGIPFLFSLLCELFQFNWITRMIIDSIHGLQGVFMFIIFVTKRNVIMDLRKKFRRSIVHSELTPLNNISGPS